MPRKKTPVTQSAHAWFAQYPPINPPELPPGWCPRHIAPLYAITRPADRDSAVRLACLDLNVTTIAKVRQANAPRRKVPARTMTAVLDALARERGGLCCFLGDTRTRAIITAATAATQTPLA